MAKINVIFVTFFFLTLTIINNVSKVNCDFKFLPPGLYPLEKPIRTFFSPAENLWTTFNRRIKSKFGNNNNENNKEENSSKSNLGKVKTFYIENDDYTGDVKMNRMVEITTLPFNSSINSCRIYGDKSAVEKVLNDDTKSPLRYLNRSQFKNVKDECEQFNNLHMGELLSNNNDDQSSGEGDGLFVGIAIYPGTKWCGAGDSAENYNDLGVEREADACCREHDHCDDTIDVGKSKHGLKNTGAYVSLNCECDKKLHDCLQNARSFIGDQIGRTYFNVLQTKCFKEDYPIVGCKDEKGFLFNQIGKACQSYVLDESKPKKWQFFDAEYFKGQSGPLLKIPGLSNIIDPQVTQIKNNTINGGLFGNIIG